MFLSHVEGVIDRWCAEAWKQEAQSEEAVISAAREKGLVSEFPNDIFTFLNQQIDILSEKLKGENMIEVIRLTFYKLGDVFDTLLSTSKEINDSDKYLNILLRLNNALMCHNHFLVLKEKCITITAPERKERVENIINEKYKGKLGSIKIEILQTIEGIVDALCRVIQIDIERELIIHMFTYSSYDNT